MLSCGYSVTGSELMSDFPIDRSIRNTRPLLLISPLPVAEDLTGGDRQPVSVLSDLDDVPRRIGKE